MRSADGIDNCSVKKMTSGGGSTTMTADAKPMKIIGEGRRRSIGRISRISRTSIMISTTTIRIGDMM